MRNAKLTENLLYRIPLEDTMRIILPFYWKAPKSVLDVTTGGKKSWQNHFINQVGLDGKINWAVTFSDISEDARPDMVADCRHLPVPDDSFDIIYYDPPFTKPENDSMKNGLNANGKPGRTFYMRNFIPLDRMFNETVEEFNRVAREGLVIKIGDRHEDRVYIAQHVDAINIYSKRFKLVDILHYRGNRPMQGTFHPFASNTVSYYLIFKKNVHRS